MPKKQRAEKIVKAILMLFRNNPKYWGVILTLPIITENKSIAMPMLNICPIIRIVAKVPDATP